MSKGTYKYVVRGKRKLTHYVENPDGVLTIEASDAEESIRIAQALNACTGISFVGESEGVVAEMVAALRGILENHFHGVGEDKDLSRWITEGCNCDYCRGLRVLSRVEVKGNE